MSWFLNMDGKALVNLDTGATVAIRTAAANQAGVEYTSPHDKRVALFIGTVETAKAAFAELAGQLGAKQLGTAADGETPPPPAFNVSAKTEGKGAKKNVGS